MVKEKEYKKMKKILSALLSGAILTGCAFAFAACSGGDKKQDRANGMVIKGVGQTAFGDITVTVDLSGATLTDYTCEYVRLSTDGGQSWYKHTGFIEKDKMVNNEATFTAFKCDTDSNPEEYNFYTGVTVGEDTKTDIAVGDSLQISLAFDATDKYNASEGTQAFSYTVKPLSIFGTESFYFEEDSVENNYQTFGSERNTYVFESQPNKSFKIRQWNYSEADGSLTLKDADASILSNFEYKITDLEDSAIYMHPDNHNSLSGWADYDTENGIALADYGNYIKTQTQTGYDPDEGPFTQTRRVIPVLVRQKDTAERCRSAVALTYLVYEVWVTVG